MLQHNRKSLKLNMVLNAIKGLMGILFPLITFPYVSKVLGVERIGQYNFAASIISYFSLVAELGISTYAVREGARVRDHQRDITQFANEIFSINLVSTCVSYALLVLLLIVVPRFNTYRYLLLILSIQIVCKTVGMEWIYYIYEDYAYITIRSILFQLVSLILLLVLVREPADLNMYAVVTVISGAGANLLNYFYARKNYIAVSITRNINWSEHIRPILVLFAMSVTVTIYVSSDTTILGFLCDDYTVGIYSVSSKIYTIVKTLLSSILIVSIPRLSALLGNRDTDRFNQEASDIYRTLISAVIPTLVGMIALREQIIFLVSDVTYLSAASSLAILGVALFFCMVAWFWGQCILVPMKMEGVVFKATVISALINIVLNLVLIPYWKADAAAFTTAIAEGIAFAWCAHEGKKHTCLSDIRITYLKVFAGCAGVLCVIHIIGKLSLGTLTYTICAIASSVVVYVLIEMFVHNDSITGLLLAVVHRVTESV